MGFKFNPFTGNLDLTSDHGDTRQLVAVTTTPNVWEDVVVPDITNIEEVEVYDSLNMEKVDVDIMVSGGSAKIRSKKSYTYTVRVEGN
jgi:hypothetical protein